MPSKIRWALNPKKWFGSKSTISSKCDKNTNTVSKIPSQTATTRTSVSSNPRILSGKNKIQVIPVSILNNVNKPTPTVTQVQLPAFICRREKTFITSERQNIFHPTHTEPTIRKNIRLKHNLTVDTTRYNIQTVPPTISKVAMYETSTIKHRDLNISNMSNCCLVDYPRQSTEIMERSTYPTRSSSSTNYDNDNSSSSGIFTDERQCTASKETLSNLEVLSIESIADSQLSLNNSPTRPIIHHYRRPMSVFEIADDKPQRQESTVRLSHRSHSAEGILKDTQKFSPVKSPRSSAAILKKIDKRYPTSRSPSGTLEKSGFVRITNDTYRLTANQVNHFSYSRKSSINSLVPFTTFDDPLRSANDEECYAKLPRTSSTEQLNTNIQNDLRIMVNDCIRPMVSSIKKPRIIKYPQRSKRPNAPTQLNIENITDKLISSVDYSIYTRYQRCN